MKKLLGIFAVSALTILGCTTAFASNSVQGDADTDGILTAKDSAYVLQKTLDSTFKVPMADEEYSVYCDVNGDKVVNADDASLILQRSIKRIVLNLVLLVAWYRNYNRNYYCYNNRNYYSCYYRNYYPGNNRWNY